jgi:hypothetical protein
MKMKMKMLVAGAGAAGALAAIAAPASAAAPSNAKLTITLDTHGGATALVCFNTKPTQTDLDEKVSYTEKVTIWGSDKGEAKGGDDLISTFADNTVKFTGSQQLSLCRSIHYSNEKALNEDTGTFPEDEIYAKIVMVPSNHQLKTRHVLTQIVRNNF